ncbi:MAG: hypothetical protein JWP44_2685 [Mucilaginibacter sp.]|nr:hypothetical protein [Mucilaginibacter sp.]
MPVQINEVIIRAVVDPAPVSNGTNPPPPNNNAAEYEAIEKVLEIIKEKQER